MMRFLVLKIFCLAILSVNLLQGQPPPEECPHVSHHPTKHKPQNSEEGQPEAQALQRAWLMELETWVRENDNQWKTDETGANIFSQTQRAEFFVLFALLHKASCAPS